MPQTIGIKELYKNLPKIAEQAQKGQIFLVQKHAHPLFLISPFAKEIEQKKPHVLSELFALRSKITSQDVSTTIDNIVYA